MCFPIREMGGEAGGRLPTLTPTALGLSFPRIVQMVSKIPLAQPL